MALVINNQIIGQEASNLITYCYLFEPLKITISDSDNTVEQIFADLKLVDTQTGLDISTDIKYFVSDISSGGIIEVDLMEIARQKFNFDLYKINSINDVAAGDGWKTVVSEYIYKLEFYTDKSATKSIICKLPIIGGRDFENFEPTVSENNDLREIALSDLITKKLGGYSVTDFALKDLTTLPSDSSPDRLIVPVVETSTNKPCGGVIRWKSKLGGWACWGMDISVENKSHNYNNNIDTNGFSTTNLLGGNPYVAVNYSGVSTDKSLSLKSIDLNNDDLYTLSEINGSPAVYYQKTSNSKWELMRVNSISAPLNSLASGGTFTINLSSILINSQKTK